MASTQMQRLSALFYPLMVEEVRKKHGLANGGSIISFQNVDGDYFLPNGYKVLGDGDAGNDLEEYAKGTGRCERNPVFIIPGTNGEEYMLCIELPGKPVGGESWMTHYNEKQQCVSSLRGDEILTDEEFRKTILQMIGDLFPEQKKSFEQLLG